MSDKEIDKREEVLKKERKDLHRSDHKSILSAMDLYFTERAYELLEYMAKNNVECEMLGDSETDTVKPFFYYKGEWIKKEQLFENFL